MEVEGSRRSPLFKFIIQMLLLGAMAAILGILMYHALANAPAAEGPARKGLLRFAIICVAFLGLTLLVMVWAFIRYLISRRPSPAEHTHTEHVDAWAIAGQRFELPKDDTEHGDDPDDDSESWKKGPE